MMARGGGVSEIARNGSEGDITLNVNSGLNHFLHSYRSEVAEWPTLPIHKTKTYLQNTKKLCTFTIISVQNGAGTTARHIPRVVSWSTAKFFGRLSYTKDFKRPHTRKGAGVTQSV
jgi:hypothetical protein